MENKIALYDTLEQNINSFKSTQEAVEYYFNYCRNNGYPNYVISKYDKQKELERVRKSSGIITGGVAKQTMQGCGFLWCYFPHWIDVKTMNDMSQCLCLERDTRRQWGLNII